MNEGDCVECADGLVCVVSRVEAVHAVLEMCTVCRPGFFWRAQKPVDKVPTCLYCAAGRRER